MKKLIYLFLTLFTAVTYGQADFPEGVQISGGQPTTTTDPYITTTGSTGLQGKVVPINMPVTITPPTTFYTPVTSDLKGYLQGIDNALGDIPLTTAGNTTRVWFTGDATTIGAGTFYLTNAQNKGTVANVSQSVTNDDNQKKYFAQDLIGNAFATTTIFPPGVYAGNLSASTTPNSAQQRFTVELYKCDTNGTPIASGVSGAPVGDLGVTVILILDSGLLTLADGSVTNVQVSASLASQLTVNVGERIRYHVSAEKVGTVASNITESVWYGSSFNSFLDVPTPITSSGVTNVSTVTGATVTNALDNLNIGKENTSNKQNSLVTDGTGAKFPTVDAVSGGTAYKRTIAQIRALSGTLPNTNFYTTDLGQEGNWYYDASDITSVDNTGTILVTADGKRIKRLINGYLSVKWFGAVGNGVTDDSSAFGSTISVANTLKKSVFIPGSTYLINNVALFTGSKIIGESGTILKSSNLSNNNILTATSIDDWSVSGIKFLGYNTVAGNIVSDTSINNINNNGIKISGFSQRFLIENCQFYGFEGYGIYWTNAVQYPDEYVGGVVTQCVFDHNYCGSYFGAYAEYNLISNNLYTQNTYGVWNIGGNNKFSGSSYKSSYYGFFLDSGLNDAHGSVIGSDFNHCKYGLKAVAIQNGFLISDNSFYTTDVLCIGSVKMRFANNVFGMGNITFDNVVGLIFNNNSASTSGTHAPTIIGSAGQITSFGNTLSDLTSWVLATDYNTGWNGGTVIDNGVSKGVLINQNANTTGLRINASTGNNPAFRLSVNSTSRSNLSFNGTETYIDAEGTSNHFSIFTNTVRQFRVFNSTGNMLMQTGGTFTDNGVDKLQVTGTASGTVDATLSNQFVRKGQLDLKSDLASPVFTGTPTAPTAAPGTNTNQVATMAALQTATSAIRPYLVYVALISQSGTSAPTATVLENTTGQTFTWSYLTVGQYKATYSSTLDNNKTAVTFINGAYTGNFSPSIFVNSGDVTVHAKNGATATDGILSKNFLEIRIYP